MTRPPYRDPSDDYPPSRPTFRMLFIAFAVVAVAVAIVNWPLVSAYTHIAQIQTEFANVTGL